MDKTEQPITVYITYPDVDEAAKAARELVEANLAACANILPGITSIYHWEGKICEDREVILLAKTTSSKFNEIESFIRKSHPYSLPCITAWPITEISADYLNWLRSCID